MDKITTRIFALRITSLILLAVGYGWAGGHFIPSNSPWIAYGFQLVIIAILIVLALGFCVSTLSQKPRRWPLTGLTIFVVITLLINTANILHGILGIGPSSLGSQNTFADLVPISIILIADTLWICLAICGERMRADKV